MSKMASYGINAICVRGWEKRIPRGSIFDIELPGDQHHGSKR
jgi:hypothetical protein